MSPVGVAPLPMSLDLADLRRTTLQESGDLRRTARGAACLLCKSLSFCLAMKRKHVAVKAFLLYQIDRAQFVLEVLRTPSTYSQEILTALLIFDHILLLIDQARFLKMQTSSPQIEVTVLIR